MSRKTGEVLEAVDRGASSTEEIAKTLVFDILPSIIDLFVGLTYFYIYFGGWLAFVFLVNIILYFSELPSIHLQKWLSTFF